MNTKYSKVLTVILVILVAGIVGLLIFFGVDTFRKLYADREAGTMLNEYDNYLNRTSRPGVFVDGGDAPELDQNLLTNTILPGQSGDGSGVPMYNGFEVIGKIEIPKTKVELPILKELSKDAIEMAVTRLYGAYPNQVGNMVVISHNFKDGRLFSNNKKLVNGDKIYVTDNSNTKIEYEVTNTYITDREDTEYMTRDTAGKREISLSTCTDDAKQNLIIWARETN